MNKKLIYTSFFPFLLFLTLSYAFLDSLQLFFRLLIGLGFGYALVRASMGFAGGVNKLTRTGSSTLAKALMGMFVLTAVLNTTLIYTDPTLYKLSIYPINLGLIAGGLLFGFGMAFSSCCATGSLTDLASGFSRAAVTIFFFSFGTFSGFYYQGTSSFVKESLVSSSTGKVFQGGIYLPDLFTFDGFNGYFGAILLTAFFAYIVVKLATKYENRYNIKHNIKDIDMSKENRTKTKFFSYENIFVNPWKMKFSVIVIALLFLLLLDTTSKGWTATTAFGFWFSKLLMFFGASASTLSEFTAKPESFFSVSIFQNEVSVQNFGIIFGSVFALALAGSFNGKFISGLKISSKGFFTFAFGGFIMGFGTRLSNGCNVGALYTPIAEFSLSGWLYLVFVVAGGFAGNWFLRKYISSTCSP